MTHYIAVILVPSFRTVNAGQITAYKIDKKLRYSCLIFSNQSTKALLNKFGNIYMAGIKISTFKTGIICLYIPSPQIPVYSPNTRLFAIIAVR